MFTTNANLFSIFERHFPRDRAALFIEDEKGKTLSYSEMETRSAQIANYFTALGLAKGDRVAVQVSKSISALMVYLGALRAGLVYLPLNTAYRDNELAYFFADASPALVIGDPEKQASLQSLLSATSVPIATLAADGTGSVMDAADGQPGSFENVHCDRDDLAAILYTSGTTGRPKGAMLSHGNLAANALTLQALWGFSSNDVLLHALPIFHVHGLFVACHCVLAAGASMTFLPGLDIEQIKHYLPFSTVMMGVPTFYTRLLADPQFGRDHCQSMRLFISGSAPLLAQTHHQFEQRTGHRILERYGMSETGMLVSNPLEGERRAGTVGFPLPDVDVRIVDENNQPVAAGEVGSIQVKGPNIFQGYWQMPEKTAQEFTSDGFFITGDQGVMSSDGYLSIVGRAKDMVITGGYNVYPKEVEAVIDRIEGVKESAVIGLADADFGEAVVAVVVRDEGSEIDADTIRSSIKQSLANYKVPKVVYFEQELPRNTMGKVQKNLLREKYGD